MDDLDALFGTGLMAANHPDMARFGNPQAPCKTVKPCVSDAIQALERLARDGRGPTFTQGHVATHAGTMGIGTTTDDFCAAIVALESTTRTQTAGGTGAG